MSDFLWKLWPFFEKWTLIIFLNTVSGIHYRTEPIRGILCMNFFSWSGNFFGENGFFYKKKGKVQFSKNGHNFLKNHSPVNFFLSNPEPRVYVIIPPSFKALAQSLLQNHPRQSFFSKKLFSPPKWSNLKNSFKVNNLPICPLFWNMSCSSPKFPKL